MKMEYVSENGGRLNYPRIGDCGYDIFALKRTVIEPKSSTVVDTGISLKIPEGHYVRVASRSGLSVRDCVEVGAGVIDEGYRGNISIHLYNHSNFMVVIPKDKAIAQLIVTPYSVPTLKPMESWKEEDRTERGDSGFGSTDRQ